MKNLFKIAVLLLGLIFGFHVSAQSPPPFPVDPFNDSWSFYDSTNWASDEGYLPIAYTNIICDQSAWSSDDGILDCNALLLDSTNATAFLNYHIIENNGHTNLSCSAGTIWFWFSPDWDSQSQSGTGPGDWGRFVEVGDYTTNATSGWWSLLVSPDGNTIYFSGQTNGVGTNYLNAPVSWTSGSWHLIGLTYTATNSILYLDDQVATNGLGVLYPPNHDVLTNGFWIGSDLSGTQQARGQFVDFESWNMVFAGDYFAGYYNEMLPELPGSGFHMGGFSMDSFSPPDFSSGGGTNFPDTYGTNLWLYLAGIQTNTIGLFLINTEPDISYEIQSKTDLTLTNWLSEGFVLGSEQTNFTEMDLPQGNRTNNLFMRIRSWVDDGSGLPLWWQQLYFGTTGVDPYGDPDGDGWNNLQEFQNGTNPNSFNTPPAPSGLTVNYNSFSNKATVAWQTSPGPVTGYTVQDSDGNTFNFGAGTNSFVDDVSSDGISDLLDSGPTIGTTYRIQAHYAGGDSAWSGDMALEPDSLPYFSAFIISGPQGSAYLAASPLPSGTVALKVTGVDESDFNNIFIFTNFNVSVSGVTNGLYSLPNIVTAPKTNTSSPHRIFSAYYYWFVQAVGTNGNLSAANYIDQNYILPYHYSYITTKTDYHGWLVPPYFDGRAQLKQNLIFKLRAATADDFFHYSEVYPTLQLYLPVTYPTNYVFSSFVNLSPYNTDTGIQYAPYLDVFLPFDENYLFKNFVFDSSALDSGGHIATGVDGNYGHIYYNAYTNGLNAGINDNLILQQTRLYRFSAPTASGTSISPVLASDQTRWLCSYPMDSAYSFLKEIGVTNESTHSPQDFVMFNNVRNYFGLPFLSAAVGYGSGAAITLNAGNSTTQGGYFYPETAQPQFQLVEYDYWPAPDPYIDIITNGTDFPGLAGLSLTHTNPLLIASVGTLGFQLSCYAKLSVQNGYSGVYGYLGQYFDKAYKIINGTVTTNTTGVLSSYGSFFATEPGQVALVTMPDLDTGARGTGTVYAVSLAVDKNHDGNMDLSFNGTDTTSQGQPFVFWANNNFDRGHVVDGTDFEQDDLGPVDVARLSVDEQVPDCHYGEYYGTRTIPSTRDLEDYARLWVCGVDSNLLAALPLGCTVTLSWADIWTGTEYTQAGNPTIDLFTAADTDGGIGYLTNSVVASNQINYAVSPFIQRLAPGGSIQLNANLFGNTWRGNHFIWCGVTNGSGQLLLTFSDANSNVLAQSSAYIQIQDIKQMYERWTVGDEPSRAPKSVADKAVDGVITAFQYTPPQDTNTPYILLVHGWNLETWEKDRYAEAAFKRLYWQGYQGRFGSFRWPTGNKFDGWKSAATDPDNFDNSEFNAWFSGLGLKNKLADLKAEYPGNVYLMAHSMGNVVAGEALRLAGTNQLVNTYVAMQGAIPAHCYDPNATARSISFLLDNGTPNRYANYYTNGAQCYFNGSAGAGAYVNFFNTNDWALEADHWQLDQSLKPDLNFSWDGTNFFVGDTALDFPQDTYQIFANCDEARCYSLGAQPSVGGVFDTTNQVELNISPYSFGTAHKYHSGQFRSDNAQRATFWNRVLIRMGLKEE